MDEKSSKKRLRTPRKVDPKYLENAALYYLQRYASSSQNLRKILTRKVQRSCTHHDQDPAEFLPLIDVLVARYESAGLLNDTVYAESRVASLRRQGLSRQAITQKLVHKGLSSHDIAAALKNHDISQKTDGNDDGDDEHELTAARRLAQRKRIGPWRRKPLADQKGAQKEMAALARAGFSYAVAKKALSVSDDDDAAPEDF